MLDRGTLLVQLPIPQLNFGLQTGNIPLAAGCLKMAADAAGAPSIRLLPQSHASYLGDAALLERITADNPAIVGFSVYAWNIDRSIYFAGELKARCRPRIVFGGPEVTTDNARVRSPMVDDFVFGEGEAAFAALMAGGGCCSKAAHVRNADELFQHGGSPYLAGLMEPEIENMLLLETQRGCPHRCGYCFYGKARHRLTAVGIDRIMAAIRWARDRAIGEVYLLDPCLNARRDLPALLTSIAEVNPGGKLKLISEIRAEAVDGPAADRYAAAGFNWFEIGLQSTNPAALRIMNRPTDLDAFLEGTRRLKERGIRMGIDLIAGLPGDDPRGFSRSLDFVIDNGLVDDVQVFPLSILPGTGFRRRAGELGLRYDPHPPYMVAESPTFSNSAIADALDEAQERCDLSLYPFPDLDLSGCRSAFLQSEGSGIGTANVSGFEVVTKILVNQASEPSSAPSWALRVAHPYQIVLGPRVVDQRVVCRMIRRFTTANPFTPLELIFVDPRNPPDIPLCMAASRIQRPHYLDKDLAMLYPRPGNRAILFTLLSKSRHRYFHGEMQRQVLWWSGSDLPASAHMAALADFDGVFLPDTIDPVRTARWQDEWAPCHSDLPAITFADPAAQKRWICLTAADDYWLDALPDR